ncbi:hypothetical protein LXL04_032464 [Taraxacum kok-saghyz]
MSLKAFFFLGNTFLFYEKKLLLGICYETLWSIWKSRNDREFNITRLPPTKVASIIKSGTFNSYGLKIGVIREPVFNRFPTSSFSRTRNILQANNMNKRANVDFHINPFKI